MREAYRMPRLSASFQKISSAEKRRRAQVYREAWTEIQEEIDKLAEVIRQEALAELRELERYFAGLRRRHEFKASSVFTLALLEATGQGYVDDLNLRISNIQLKRSGNIETRLTGALDKAGEKFSTSTTTRLGFKHPGFPKEIKGWINTRVPELAESIGDARKRGVMRSVVRGVRSGETLDKIEGRIRKRYKGWAKSSPASIARTEVGFIQARSQWATINKLGIPPNELIKIWLTARDSRVRGLRPRDTSNHVVLDGQRRTFFKRFSNGLMYPRQPGGRASEVVNCRCVMLFERSKKMRRVRPGKFGTVPKKTIPFNQFGDVEPAFSIVLPEELIQAIPSAVRDDALEGARALYNVGKAAEPELSTLFNGIAKLQKGEVHGFAFRLKTRKSILSKVGRLMRDKGLTLPQALDGIHDVNRYTMTFKHKTFVKNAKSAVKAFEKKGWRLIKARNAFGEDMYHGYNLKFEKAGRVIEVQFHTPTSIVIKDPSHILYDQSRELAKGSAKRLALEKGVKNLWNKDILPAGNWKGLPQPGDLLKPKTIRPFTGKPPVFKLPKTVKIPVFKTVREAEEWARTQGIAGVIDYGAMDVKTANDVNRALFDMKNRWGWSPKNVSTINEVGQTLAKATVIGDEYYIKLNTPLWDVKRQANVAGEKAYRAERIERIRDRITAAKNVPGSDAEYWQKTLDDYLDVKRWMVDPSTYGVVVHEYGHLQLFRYQKLNRKGWYRMKTQAHELLMKTAPKDLGEYAQTSFDEYFAESWVAYNKGEKIPTLMEQFITEVREAL